MAAVAGLFGPGGGDDRGHQRRRMNKDNQTTTEGKTPDGFSEP